ncbi:hypothetical protein Q3304_09295 [Clostridioides sp. GD02377]|uniref:hypothetical protein n=1 Tax=unclassified Clostridioides TaxID=2635829 RepID=UPI0038A3F075
MKAITTVDLNKIIYSNPFDQKLICMISILEAYLNLISKDHLESVGKEKISDITLENLGTIYSSVLNKHSGLNGVCWEYAVYNAIYYDDDFIQNLLNLSINYLSGENTFYRLNAILWGGEKANLDLDNINESINDEDLIWTSFGTYKFKEYIDMIHKSFREKLFRKQLPEEIRDIWKTDLFVKKENSNIWYAVTVKWNKNDVKQYPGLSIGIHYEHIKIQKHEINPYLINNSFVRCSIPFEHNFGEYYSYMFRFFKLCLEHINFKKKNTIRLELATSEEYGLFEILYKLKKVPCCTIINYLKDKYCYKNNTFVKPEIVLSNNKPLVFAPIDVNEIKNANGTIIIPT